MPLTTQQFLAIEDIREGTLVLKDKSLRGILMVSSINFALKSKKERDAIIYQFQDFLNSLDFPVEIVVQSRKANITSYLDKLKDLEKQQENELMATQVVEYRNFIQKLVQQGSIMTKTFYIVIPFTLMEIPGLGGEPGGKEKKKKGKEELTEEKFQRAKSQLWQRMEFAALGIKRCGVDCSLLGTSELIELFWSIYHPDEAEAGYYPEIPPELVS